ncbi:hypothetical protein [Paenibacillus thiaminolyticus]|uniref:Replication initiation factor n=1 Tax=Paenibacillus thiaminolyticus TaxID=49283 RepID=A0A3A3GJB8_PANTH|nr:hypothetical protein [Paenibacillus thiaminolyticus]RJG23306.1 hypothetical protein DQX05_13740 [Paenibacillus thiaminolyticus]RJG23323.1 hypothetical protein DQX05_13830 [Paenibacillus thiaminolyticus]
MGIFNCDWLSFTVDFKGYQAASGADAKDVFDPEQNKHLARLFAALDEQREKSDDGYIDLGLFNFRVLNHGSRSYYYLLHNDDLEIRLAKFRSKKEEVFPVYVHFKSQFLWTDIYSVTMLDEKYRMVIEWLEDVLNCKYIRSKINRMDLCYHTDDVPEGFNTKQFVGRYTSADTRETHRVTTGINIGSRMTQKLYLRCYNKFLEARAKKKVWFFKLWERNGMNIRKVWNIEFQIDREFFTEFKVGQRKLDTAEDAIEYMAVLWNYLTAEWISYRIPDDDRRSRWTIHPWWLSLSKFSETDAKVSREMQRELPTMESIIPGLRGYLTSYAARMGGNLQDGSLFQTLLEDINKYDEQAGKQFAEVVDVKRQLMDPACEKQLAERLAKLIETEEDLHKRARKGEIEKVSTLYGLPKDIKKRDADTSLPNGQK